MRPIHAVIAHTVKARRRQEGVGRRLGVSRAISAQSNDPIPLGSSQVGLRAFRRPATPGMRESGSATCGETSMLGPRPSRVRTHLSFTHRLAGLSEVEGGYCSFPHRETASALGAGNPKRTVFKDDAAVRIATKARSGLKEDVGRRLSLGHLLPSHDGVHGHPELGVVAHLLLKRRAL